MNISHRRWGLVLAAAALVSLGSLPSRPARSASRELLFASKRGAQQDLFLLEPDTGKATKLTTNGMGNALPAWSPDGKRLAFTSREGGGGHIWLMNADGTGLSS